MGKTPAKKPKWRVTPMRRWREAAGMTLREMSVSSGINEGYLSEIENGHARYNQDVVEAYMRILHVSEGDLLNKLPPQKDTPPDPSSPSAIAALAEKLKPEDRRRLANFMTTMVDDPGQ